MNLKDLYDIVQIQKEINIYQRKIICAREAAEKITASYSLTPGSGVGSKVENAVVDIAYYENLIADKKRELHILKTKLKQVIAGSPDPIVRAALSMRYDLVPGQTQPTWSQVALNMGTSADSIRMACKRYLKNIT